jgi:hypothetical protein
MKNIKFFEEFESNDSSQGEIHENHEGHELDNYMFFQNLHTLKNAIDELMELDPHEVDQILTNGHGWALDHIATSVDDVEEVYHFMANSIEMGSHGEEEQHGGGEMGDSDDDEGFNALMGGKDAVAKALVKSGMLDTKSQSDDEDDDEDDE